jgi:hypothetical protein
MSKNGEAQMEAKTREMIMAADVENFTIKYFRTEGEMEEDEGKSRIFGVSAEIYIGNELIDENDAGFISADIEHVNALIAILGRNTVTPYALGEVLDEIMSA